jgi:hypothetical protein
MENNVVTLETAKKLQAAGFPQSGLFAWRRSIYGAREPFVDQPLDPGAEGLMCYAPTAQEIADQLAKYDWDIRYMSSIGYMAVVNKPRLAENGDTMAEALAALYIKLKKDIH